MLDNFLDANTPSRLFFHALFFPSSGYEIMGIAFSQHL